MILAKIGLKTKRKNKLRLVSQLTVVTMAFFVVATALPSNARTFDPNNIITDQDLFDPYTLSTAAIQKFLEREGSVLARFSQVVDGRTLKASEMIWEIGLKHSINPKFLLTTLEKEQSLISRVQATEKALDWATGYSCYGGGCNEKYRGFYNQVESAAETQEIYRQKASQFGFRVGVETTTFDNYKVTPQNQATANLYIYTPYVGNAPELGIVSRFGANRLFWRIWHRYFSDQKFLDGQVVTNGSDFWLITKNTKQKFISRQVLAADSNPSDAIFASSTDLAAYPDGPTIYFTNNTVVKSAASGQIFFIDQKTKRPIIDATALALLSDVHLALTETEILSVPDNQLAAYEVGATISGSSIYPQGKLLQDETGTLWWAQDSLKYLVDPMVKQNRFANQTPEVTTTGTLSIYPNGEPMKLKDGTFVLANGNYYLISAGARMKIDHPDIIDRVFGAQKRIGALSISSALLEYHSAGEIIDYIDDTVKDTTVTQPTPTPAVGSYAATFAEMTPNGLTLINGAQESVTISVTNTGSANWQPGSVWLAPREENTFALPEKINFNESSVSAGQTANFTFTVTAPTDQSGLLTQNFAVDATQNNSATQLTSFGKFIVVKAGTAAQIVSHNLPVAVRNTWRPIEITMEIKNISPDITWLSRRTALEVYNDDDTPSDFYDPNDWVRREVAAVPINKSTIAPGETGKFVFTIDPRGIPSNTHILRFRLKLLDKDKEIYLNGKLNWDRLIRVD